jgi:hypothetical protein
MCKQAFFEDLQDILADKISIVNMPIKNMWSISIPNNLVHEIQPYEFLQFINTVISTRKSQVSSLNEKLIFYAWIDFQAFQFRFSIILKNEKLPFNSNITISDNLEKLIITFFNYLKTDSFKNSKDVYICDL